MYTAHTYNEPLTTITIAEVFSERMNSARGTRTVRLQRKQSGFDFSVKGGREHGIPVVVSWIKENGAAASSLNLGDEILAVNGQPLNGLTHKEAVARLKGAGSAVILRVRPNQTLGDVFSSEREDSSVERAPKPRPPLLPAECEHDVESSREQKVPHPPTTVHHVTKSRGPLPPGWGEKIDLKTGRPYYENHYTQTSTWTDPRSLEPAPVKSFEWNKLPSGWERHLDQHGDIYYVCHDTQSTHWDSPRGMRQQTQITEIHSFIQEHKDKLKAEEKELKQKRELLLQKNQTLNSMSEQPQQNNQNVDKEGKDGEGEDPVADLIDDIMLLNEEVESQDGHVTTMRRHLHSLAEVLQEAHLEELGEKDEHAVAAKLAVELVKTYSQLKTLEAKLLEQLQSIGDQTSRDPLSTPLPYMLQLPPTQSLEEVVERQQWLHSLPDKLTAKTNCEMRVELCVIRESYKFAMSLQEKLAMFYGKALQVTHKGWEQLIENLATWDFTLLHDQWLNSTQIREKLERLLMF